MVSPRKRKGSRTEQRASRRYTPPAPDGGLAASLPRPPDTCPAWHFFWCDDHADWHHHDEFVIAAIERSGNADDTGDAFG